MKRWQPGRQVIQILPIDLWVVSKYNYNTMQSVTLLGDWVTVANNIIKDLMKQ